MPRVRLFHISDLHWEGQTHNWQTVVTAVNEYKPNVLCVTGDIVDSPSTRKLQEAAEALGRCAKDVGAELIVVPGNHDVYPKGIVRHPAIRRPFANAFGFPSDQIAAAERVRREFGIGIVLVDSTRLSRAEWVGSVGRVDRVALHEALRMQGQRPDVTVALVHHHLLPFASEKWDTSLILRNAGEVLLDLMNAGVDVVLHGHKHRPYIQTLLVRESVQVGNQELECLQPLVNCGNGSSCYTKEGSLWIRMVDVTEVGEVEITTLHRETSHPAFTAKGPPMLVRTYDDAVARRFPTAGTTVAEVDFKLMVDGSAVIHHVLRPMHREGRVRFSLGRGRLGASFVMAGKRLEPVAYTGQTTRGDREWRAIAVSRGDKLTSSVSTAFNCCHLTELDFFHAYARRPELRDVNRLGWFNGCAATRARVTFRFPSKAEMPAEPTILVEGPDPAFVVEERKRLIGAAALDVDVPDRQVVLHVDAPLPEYTYGIQWAPVGRCPTIPDVHAERRAYLISALEERNDRNDRSFIRRLVRQLGDEIKTADLEVRFGLVNAEGGSITPVEFDDAEDLVVNQTPVILGRGVVGCAHRTRSACLYRRPNAADEYFDVFERAPDQVPPSALLVIPLVCPIAFGPAAVGHVMLGWRDGAEVWNEEPALDQRVLDMCEQVLDVADKWIAAVFQGVEQPRAALPHGTLFSRPKVATNPLPGGLRWHTPVSEALEQYLDGKLVADFGVDNPFDGLRVFRLDV